MPPSSALLAVHTPCSAYPSDTVNSAGRRTIQARNHIVRVPAIVRVKSLGTYPHYRGHPTVSSSEKLDRTFQPQRMTHKIVEYTRVLQGLTRVTFSTSWYTMIFGRRRFYEPFEYVPRTGKVSIGSSSRYSANINTSDYDNIDCSLSPHAKSPLSSSHLFHAF